MNMQQNTPLADALIQVLADSALNFHAVPWGGVSATDSPVSQRYRDLFGDRISDIDVSMAAPALDSFFRPRGPLQSAQELAAEAFGVDATHFLTGGTTLANTIAVTATVPVAGRVMIDHTSHQSVHFAAAASGAVVTSMPPAPGNRCPDYGEVVNLLRRAATAGQPFDAVVVTTSTYDGHRLRCDQVLPLIAEASPTTAIVLDDAWAAIHCFSPQTHSIAPTRVAASLRARPGPVLIVHSAHKTMRAMRQGSYLHVIGDTDVRTAVQQSIFRHHTTSPSWPILASLDLARADAASSGPVAVDRSLQASSTLTRSLNARPDDLNHFRVVPAPLPAAEYVTDLMRLHIRVPEGHTPVWVRDSLWHEHRIHVPRVAGRHLVVSITIGIDNVAADKLATALTLLENSTPILRQPPQFPNMIEVSANEGDLIIAYPPGRPVSSHLAACEALSNGSELFTVPARAGSSRNVGEQCLPPPNSAFPIEPKQSKNAILPPMQESTSEEKS
ncbi:hypothetical protein DBV08_04105 [Rhodococcus sp. KBW08]|uniref:hypothetical protein n=1 Tax=Rhodococcus sp. KBW08 TaxID=2144188 RepID=UPI000F595D1A|nr:hypothetical protein [Rhodococcus sp. KBW08]RQO51200.1 hypothetical protein DBV08_04105 [Rhodococcus sp. KBW08]